MGVPSDEWRLASCAGKQRFGSFAEVRRALRRPGFGHTRRHRARVQAYRCRFCRGMHVGSDCRNPRWERQLAEERRAEAEARQEWELVSTMARLKTVEISLALRNALAAATFSGFELVQIPTGRDPRKFTEADQFPQAVVQLTETQTTPKSVGGGTEAIHRLELCLLFQYEDGDDLNLLKLARGAELFDWLCSVKSGDGYKLFITDDGGGQYPELEYEPSEELVYVAQASNIAVIKLSCGVRQTPFFNVNG